MIRITDSIAIEESELDMEFVRASGPGGQNVNKVATVVQLRFDVRHSAALTEDVRERLVTLAGRRMTGDGVLVITARRHRTQRANREDAIERLVKLIRRAARKPKPRKITTPTKASVEQRLEQKRQRAKIKRRRQKPKNDTD
ncbi:MAG: alternative ribosome rescue aminoacyl-tRNA hydrolase ArfB [Candidatus Krumholzibacteria bacterium]|nr:alternative ribosome rescue aminoacyl-tRNA hydrolase ArfB [Candidatus Krumholzibacteria bacterium]